MHLFTQKCKYTAEWEYGKEKSTTDTEVVS